MNHTNYVPEFFRIKILHNIADITFVLILVSEVKTTRKIRVFISDLCTIFCCPILSIYFLGTHSHSDSDSTAVTTRNALTQQSAIAATATLHEPRPAGGSTGHPDTMSPRTTDVSAPGHNIHAAPSPAVVHSNRAPSSTATTTHVQNNGVTTIPVQRRKGKPLSSGWKSLAWTKPHSNNLHQSPGHKKTATATPSQQQQQSPPPPQPPQQQAEERDIPNGRADHSPSSTSHHHRHHQQQPKEIAVSVEVGSTKFGGGPTSSLTSPPREEEAAPGAHRHHRHHKKTHKRRPREEQQPATVSSRGQPQTSFPAAITATGRSASVSRAKRWIPSARSEEFSSNSGAGAQATTFADFLKPVLDTAGYQTAPVGVAGGLTGLDALVNHSAPGQHRRQSSGADQDGNTIVMERSVSDSSIVTASDFGAPKKSNLPTILTDMKDEDAVVELVALLAKGRGLPVVKHAGSGGGKSRKLLKFNEIEGWVALCGMLPPYFKTKIMVRDIDRVDAKWCCVVVHAKGRSPVSACFLHGAVSSEGSFFMVHDMYISDGSSARSFVMRQVGLRACGVFSLLFFFFLRSAVRQNTKIS